MGLLRRLLNQKRDQKDDEHEQKEISRDLEELSIRRRIDVIGQEAAKEKQKLEDLIKKRDEEISKLKAEKKAESKKDDGKDKEAAK